MTGPVREAMSSWIERLNFTLVEQTQRRFSFPTTLLTLTLLSPVVYIFPFFVIFHDRRISSLPEKGIVRGYLMELFVRTHSEDLVPLDPLRPPPLGQRDLYDAEDDKGEVQVRSLRPCFCCCCRCCCCCCCCYLNFYFLLLCADAGQGHPSSLQQG